MEVFVQNQNNCSNNLNNSGFHNEGNDQSLSAEQYMELLEMEQQITQGVYNLEIVNKCMQYYSKLVEYFDQMNDNIKIYFLQKIQHQIINQKTVMKLLNCNEKGESLHETSEFTYNQYFNQQQYKRSQDSFQSNGSGNYGYYNNQDQYFVDGNQGYLNNSDQYSENHNEKQENYKNKKVGMRQGLLKMQAEMEKRKKEAPLDYKTQQYVKSRQMQIMIEAEKKIAEIKQKNNNNKQSNHNTEEGVNQDDNNGENSGKNQNKDGNQEESFSLQNVDDIIKDDEKRQDIIKKEDKAQEDSIQARLLERRKRKQQKMNVQTNDQSQNFNVFGQQNNQEQKDVQNIQNERKGSISLGQNQEIQNEQNVNRNDNSQNLNNNSMKINQQISQISLPREQKVSQIVDFNAENQEEVISQSLNQEDNYTELQEELLDEVDIEDHLLKFEQQVKNKGLPNNLKNKLSQVKNFDDLDDKTKMEMEQYINDFEKKTQMSKSMTQFELQQILRQNSSSQQKKNMTNSMLQPNNFGNQESKLTMSNSPFGKKSRRNLSLQFVDTRQLNQEVRSLANNLQKVSIIENSDSMSNSQSKQKQNSINDNDKNQNEQQIQQEQSQ
ncbi:hypothetical protein PPERSA_08159 [Pseudocohnilembus persalinus]|uniref:Uncharacterized protein n=1 Tax=Pseudocohnilembus persalinus TaxID=266149 RepID=A0A0V0R373_PSEPJ|nr:hypothetical protein PPERSA_08159 [Pseudocohnilembus persalinus]|eukprot:KRX08956.1 hypothetical protein PPERSA_08159 [Pseudocohnilembus persalinus]